MIRLYNLLLLVFFVPILVPAQNSNWKTLDSIYKFDGKPWALDYMSIDCADTNNCTSVLNLNTDWPFTRTTTDGGKTWFTSLFGSTKGINIEAETVHYPSLDLCIILCNNGYYFRSTDTCKTWEKLRITDKADGWPGAAQMVDSKTGFVWLYLDSSYTKFPIIFKTDDSAKTWKEIHVIPDSINFPIGGLLTFSFINSNKYILLVTEPMENNFIRHIIGTEDGGQTWAEYPFPTSDKSVSIQKLYFRGNLGWAIGSRDTANGRDIHFIFRTSDEGQTWSKVLENYNGNNSSFMVAIDFADDLHGAVLAHTSLLYLTNDGGLNWTLEDNISGIKPIPIGWFNDISMPAPDVLYSIYAWTAQIFRRYWYPVSVNDAQPVKDNYEVYPNPVYAGQEVNVKFNIETFAELEFSLYIPSGQLIDEGYRSYFVPGEHAVQYLTDKYLSSGLYFIRVECAGNEIVFLPVIIKH